VAASQEGLSFVELVPSSDLAADVFVSRCAKIKETLISKYYDITAESLNNLTRQIVHC
jgi:hypothetical protein